MYLLHLCSSSSLSEETEFSHTHEPHGSGAGGEDCNRLQWTTVPLKSFLGRTQSLHAIPQAAVYHYSSLFSLHQTPRIPKLHERAVNDEGEDCKVVWDRNQPSESHWVRCDKSVLSHLTVGADGLTTWLNKTTICCSTFFFFFLNRA